MDKWTPANVLRMVALVGGLAGFYWGATLVQVGLAQEGAVDLKSALFSGTLRTTSAGLFICFFALALCAFVVIPLARKDVPDDIAAIHARSRTRTLLPLVYAILVAILIGSAGGFTTANAVLTALLAILIVVIIWERT